MESHRRYLEHEQVRRSGSDCPSYLGYKRHSEGTQQNGLRLEVVAASSYKVHKGWVNNRTTPTQAAIAQFNVANWLDRPARELDLLSYPKLKDKST